MAKDFKFEGSVIVSNLNPRPEAAGKNKRARLAVDVKILLEKHPAEILRTLQPSDPSADLDIVGALFTKDGVPRFYSMSGIGFAAEYAPCSVTIAEEEFEKAKVKDFMLLKCHEGGLIDLEFKVQVHPEGDQLARLGDENTAADTHLVINPAQQTLDV